MIRIPHAILHSGTPFSIADLVERQFYWGQLFCPGCQQPLRFHDRRKPNGPQPHLEHRKANPDCPLMKKRGDP